MKKLVYFTKNFLCTVTSRMKKIYLVVLLTVISVCADAQYDGFEQFIERDILGSEDINEEAKEKKQIIGAARSSKSVEELPVTLYIITRDEIIGNGYVTLCDVLKNVPGIRVSQPSHSEQGEGFMQRGMIGNTYTKILLNGIDIKPSGATYMPLGANLPIRQAERIEIIYGPASASYGNDACSGVINIVTKRPGDKAFTNADIMVGTGGKRYLNFNAGSKLGHGKHVVEFNLYGSDLNINSLNLPGGEEEVYNRWNYFFQNGEVINYQGYAITPDLVTQETFEKYKFLFSDMELYFVNYQGDFFQPYICNRPQNATQTGINLRYRGVEFAYNMLHRMDFTNNGVTPFTYNYGDPQAMFGDYIHRFALSGDWQDGSFTTNTSLHLIHYRIDQNSYRTVNWDKNRQYFYGACDDLGIEENITWKPVPKLDINAGGSFTYTGVLPKTMDNSTKFDFSSYKMFAESVDFNYPLWGNWGIYPYTYWQAGAYVQADYDLKPVNVTAGLRYDYNSQWGSSLNPRVALLWKITDKLTMRASEGFAYKTPAPNQIYYIVLVAVPNENAPGEYVLAYHHIPTTGKLVPEHISSTELGFRMYFNKTDYLELVGYTNRLKDPLIRNWVAMEDIANYVPQAGAFMSGGEKTGYIADNYLAVGVTNLTNSEVDRKYTRAYANETDSKSKLYGLQLIGVVKDVCPEVHLNIKGGVTLSFGQERISANNAGETKFNTINYVRGVPKTMVQLSAELDFLKIMHFRADNIYCTKFARRYYNGVDNRFFWAPSYYNLDVNLTAKISKNLVAGLKVTNVTNKVYGGMDAMEIDVDLPYNPQILRSFTFGVTYDF
jgi:hemoglobin/transferrin/lactoferrin receptor protein